MADSDEREPLDQLLLDLRDLGWLTPSDALLLRESREWWAEARSDAISLDLAALRAENRQLRAALKDAARALDSAGDHAARPFVANQAWAAAAAAEAALSASSTP